MSLVNIKSIYLNARSFIHSVADTTLYGALNLIELCGAVPLIVFYHCLTANSNRDPN